MSEITKMEKDELSALFNSALAEIKHVEAVSSEFESINRDIRIIGAQPISGLTVGGAIGWWFLYYIGFGFAFGVLGVITLLLTEIDSDAFVYVMVPGIFLSMFILAPVFARRKHNAIIDNATGAKSKRITELEKLSKETGRRLDQIIAQVCNHIYQIPDNYRYSLALETMLGYIRAHRADNWKECASLYEEQMHRWTLERNSSESIRLQQEMLAVSESTAQSASAAALFAGIAAVASVETARRTGR